MPTKTKKAATSGNATASEKAKPATSMKPKASPGQPLPLLSKLLITDDLTLADSPAWVIDDISEDATELVRVSAADEFITEARRIAKHADAGDLGFIVRAFRHAMTENGDEVALPGRVLASLVMAFGIDDLGTGRREKTRRLLAASAARERLRKADVQYVDDMVEGVADKC